MPGAAILQNSIKPSLHFAMVLLLLHLLAAAVLYMTDILWPAKLAMLMLIILSLAYYFARDILLLFRDSWRDVSFDQKEALIATRDGNNSIGQVANTTFVSPYFVVLCVKLERQHPLACRVIFPDAMSAGAFRELCVHLKFA